MKAFIMKKLLLFLGLAITSSLRAMDETEKRLLAAAAKLSAINDTEKHTLIATPTSDPAPKTGCARMTCLGKTCCIVAFPPAIACDMINVFLKAAVTCCECGNVPDDLFWPFYTPTLCSYTENVRPNPKNDPCCCKDWLCNN